MTFSVHEPLPLYSAIGTRLATTGKLVGYSQSPGGDKPYMVLDPVDELFEGSIGDPSVVDVHQFYVRCIGDTLDEAQWMQGKARGVLVGWTPTVTGLTTFPIRLDQAIGRGRDPQGTAITELDRYEIFTSK